MASTRKSRTLNKRFSKLIEESPDKDAETLSKSRIRKRKLSDMLGSQWSKDELERFYEAYRRYGKNWKKVARTIRDRSTDMIEALYNMNKAYLSLPDGMATAAGLIAMMTDHYNNLEESESERERNDETRLSVRAQKGAPRKFRLNCSKTSTGSHSDLVQYQNNKPDIGCLSLLKKKRTGAGGSQPRVVGKRTPRFPVSHASGRNERDKSVFARRHGLMSEKDAADDEGAHVAAVALAQARQRGSSPHVFRTLVGKKDIQRDGRKFAALEDLNSRFNLQLNEENQEDSLGSREAETEDFIRDSSIKRDYEGAERIPKKHKIKKIRGKSLKAVTDFDDTREACSGTEEGLNFKTVKDEASMDIIDHNVAPSPQALRRSGQLYFGDENREFDALQTLADLSLNMLTPSCAMESEPPDQVQDDKNINITEKANNPEKFPKQYQRDKSRISAKKEKGQQSTADADTVNQKTSKARKMSSEINDHARRQETLATSKNLKRKNKNMEEKIPKPEVDQDPCVDESHKIEGAIEDEKRTSNKARQLGLTVPSSGRGKSAKSPGNLSSSTDTSKTATDATELAPQVSATTEVHLPAKFVSRRKMALKNIMAQRGLKSCEGVGENRPDKHIAAVNEKVVHLKETLTHCLLSPLLRRWCMFEWFYSAIDYPWFAKSEFVEYLNHVGLGHVPRLTRIEWGVIRSSLGKPRRLSQQFLKEEREKLEQYRESVRSHYAELRAGAREGLPTDLARPLSVGQWVIACHPKTREIHDGSVLTVDHNKCLVQFDQPELGVENVMDVDCMPLNPLENMPDALRTQNLMVNGLADIYNVVKPSHLPKDWRSGSSSFISASDNKERDGSNGFLSNSFDTLIMQAKEDTVDAIGKAKAAINQAAAAARHVMDTQLCTLDQIQAKEADIKVLAELARALDKKEALLIELRNLNSDVPLVQKEGESHLEMERFRRQYAMVLLQLKDINNLVSSALLSLRQRNTYRGCPPLSFRPLKNTDGMSGVGCSFDQSLFNQQSSCHVLEVVESARRQARTMVEAAMQAISSTKVGEPAASKVGDAIDSSEKWQISDPGVPLARFTHDNDQGYHNLVCQAPSSCLLEPKVSNAGHELKCLITDRDESQIPSELISSCVASALMIQRCAERQLPPAEVAQVLESAVSGLSPCCSQNIPIYQEIEDFMGTIKNQMLALVPSPTLTLPVEHSVA